MSRPLACLTWFSLAALGGSGCVSVDTPDAKVNVGITQVNLPRSESHEPESPPYARPLKKVTERQAKVAKEISKRDWEEVVSKSNDWIDDIRTLAPYARSSHDPKLFDDCCRQLLEDVQALRQAAMRKDAAAVQHAFDACDQPLNVLTHNFPPTVARSTAAAPPPQPQPAPAADKSTMVP